MFSFFNPNQLKSIKQITIPPKSDYKKISLNNHKSILMDEEEGDKSVKNMLPELQFNYEDE